MKFGFAQQKITPELPCLLAGYAKHRVANAVHDDLYVKVFVFQAETITYAIIAYDLLAVDHLLINAVKKQCETVNFKIDHMFFTAIHTHSGPGGILDSTHGFLKGAKALLGDVDAMYVETIAEKSVIAIKEAVDQMQEGTIKCAYGSCQGIGSNRNQQDLPGNSSLWIAEAENLTQKALIVNFACHPTILGVDNLSVSADYCGAYAAAMKEQGYAMCLFLNGSCGDISSRFTRKASDFNEVKRMGETLAQATIKLQARQTKMNRQTIAYAPVTVSLQGRKAKSVEEAKAILEKRKQKLKAAQAQNISRQALRLAENAVEGATADLLYSMHHDGITEYCVRAEMLKIGDDIFIGIPGELFSELSNAYEDAHTHFISYMNGYQMYFANAYAYEKQFYEAANSPFAKYESEKLMKQIERQINEWRKEA